MAYSLNTARNGLRYLNCLHTNYTTGQCIKNSQNTVDLLCKKQDIAYADRKICLNLFVVYLTKVSNSSKPMEGENLKLVAPKVGRLHLRKTKLSESTRLMPKARARQGGTEGEE